MDTACKPFDYKEDVTTSPKVVADWFGPMGLWVVRIHVTAPIRVTITWGTHQFIKETVTFDVVSFESFVLPAKNVKVEAYAHITTATVNVAMVETASWARTEVALNLQVPAGETDSDVTTTIKPPRGALAVMVDPDDADDYLLKLYDPTGTRVGTFTRTTLPPNGARLGRASRVVIAADGSMRLSYRIIP